MKVVDFPDCSQTLDHKTPDIGEGIPPQQIAQDIIITYLHFE